MSTPTTTPIPIVLVGIHTSIGEAVAAGLRPEFDIIRFIQTYPAAESDLPYLLRGEAPPTAPTNAVGSADYSRGPARAIVFGRGFSQKQAEDLYAANKDNTNTHTNNGPGSEEGEGVAWIAGEEAKRPASFEPPPGIEKVMVPIFRGALEKWVKGGRKGGLVLY